MSQQGPDPVRFLVTVQRWRPEDAEARQKQLQEMWQQVKRNESEGKSGQNLDCGGIPLKDPFPVQLVKLLKAQGYRLDKISYQYYKNSTEDDLEAEQEWYENVLAPAAEVVDPDFGYFWRASMKDPSVDDLQLSVY